MKKIKNFGIIVFALFSMIELSAQEKPKSTAEKASGSINGANIEINYFSPSVRGRKIWGELVPFDKLWRAGANDATTFSTDKDITVAGNKLPAGKYSFFVIPNEKECVVIFNKEAKQWGAYKYNEKEDQLRITVKPTIVKSSTEKLVYSINSKEVVLSWDTWNIGFSVK